MLRTCAPIGVDDCETANGVTYCYCKNELCNNPSKKLSNPNPGSGLLSSPQKSDLLIDTNRQNIEGDDEMDKEEIHHFDEGSGWYDEYHYSDDSDYDDDYSPENEDQTEPPLYITEENDLYQNPSPPPRGNKDDFGFVEDNNQLDQTSFRNSHKNAKSNHRSKSATSQQQPVITSGSPTAATAGSINFFVKLSTWLLVFSYAASILD